MPGGLKILDTKKPSETCFAFPFFDFISWLQTGETITSQSVTASIYSGTDGFPFNTGAFGVTGFPSPGSIISGSATLVNLTQVSQLITGGVNGVIYQLSCSVTTNLGQTLVQSGLLAVYDTPTNTTSSGFPFNTGAFGVTGF